MSAPRGSLAQFQTLIRDGAKFLCVNNTYRPELNGQWRTIVNAQRNGWFWTVDGEEPRSTGRRRFWTNMPKAAEIQAFRSNGFGLVTVTLRAPVAGDHSITLEFEAPL